MNNIKLTLIKLSFYCFDYSYCLVCLAYYPVYYLYYPIFYSSHRCLSVRFILLSRRDSHLLWVHRRSHIDCGTLCIRYSSQRSLPYNSTSCLFRYILSFYRILHNYCWSCRVRIYRCTCCHLMHFFQGRQYIYYWSLYG